ncbi:RND transporter [Niabella ginsenosidivorans]|uniref:RND transporter n=2 Tax=Niabella ginsenosidivorans TaxID=1176587 RepID=A0A1A9I640_9BACT|nr:RND transporter [Niabella ginsenosidivorans]
MWKQTGRFILKYRVFLLVITALLTTVAAYWASKVGLSYEFSRAIPTNHPVNIAYQQFKKKYGEDGNMLVIGIRTDQLFSEKMFNSYRQLQDGLKKIPGVEDVISVPTAINLVKDATSEKLTVKRIFPDEAMNQTRIDSGAAVFQQLPFYQGLLYNPRTHAYLMGLRMNKEVINSAKRDAAIAAVKREVAAFQSATGIDVKLSGLPYIRTVLAARIAHEMRYFLAASILLSAFILILFFRSFSSMLLSLSVVIIGVLFSMGTMHLFGYSITLLTALIPPLIVVIGIPNCIYFLNKFHTSWNELTEGLTEDIVKVRSAELKRQALEHMVSKMGVVTLFCNLAAAVGFAVFAFTRSEILQEFGAVAGINIMLLFFISLVLIPSVLSFLPPPKPKHTRYLDNARLNRWLDRLEKWSMNHRNAIYSATLVIVAIAVAGIFRLQGNAHMVDDVPHNDKIYTDLKFFEKNFKGVMPLEILVNTKKKYGVTRNFGNLVKIDSLSQYLAAKKEIARPLSITEGLKFAKQAFYEGDSSNYSMPSEFDLPGLSQYLNMGSSQDTAGKGASTFTRLLSSFMDSAKQEARISVNMADVGSHQLPALMNGIQKRIHELFPAKDYDVTLTGTTITFLEGGQFIINGLKESIFWAFLLIALCMLYLFRSLRILLCSLIPNIIPLVITAGVMGWAGIPLKPSTVLIFSVALGIAIDITIRFLVNYKQELPGHDNEVAPTVVQTIHSTGISILYTSMVLIAGFVIFCFSNFGGTQALGWLTSLTLITATFTNLILLPALLISFSKKKTKKNR